MRAPAASFRIAVLVDQWPALSETFVVNEVVALARLGHDVRVESASWAEARADVPAPIAVACSDDDGRLRRLRDLLWLALRNPAGVWRDLRDRRRWQREEVVRPLRALAPVARRLARARSQHLHAHFAAGAALDALRLGRLLGLPYSVTAHAYDIYQHPRNLREKLRCAAFSTSGCAYTVGDLKRIVGADRAATVHEIVMGVDGETFRRSRPYAGGRTVVGVGRLVEKKGFMDLIEAVARMRSAGAAPERVRIVGDGPLAAALAARSVALGVDDLVELPGALSADGVRALLDDADVLCMPCVVAADGDRDSMPVVVKEALAMEVPVVVTDEVGLPELVRSEWGRLVPPRDPAGLAAALTEVLALPAEERRAMGRAGRAHVLAACDLDTWTGRLIGLLAAGQPTAHR